MMRHWRKHTVKLADDHFLEVSAETCGYKWKQSRERYVRERLKECWTNRAGTALTVCFVHRSSVAFFFLHKIT